MTNSRPGPYRWGVFFQALMALLIGALIAGCQSPRQALQQLADEHGRQLQILPGQPFALAALLPNHVPPASRLRVYLEGDGHAWATATQPSLDPSPRKLLVPRLAIDDPTPNAYLARPCQFVTSPGCKTALWTDRRFSQEVVTSLSQALDLLKQRYGNQSFELVGYSGGAALALLLAAQRDDVTQVQTLAGNLSPRLWAHTQHLTPLAGSLDPLDYPRRLAGIPQRHFSGTLDEVVPTALAQAYRERLRSGVCSRVVLVEGVSHEAGWDRVWRLWRDRGLDRSGECAD
ncbi:alpha/beta hydrolase [Pseudomonas viridiflava]|uniref:alpha/beta hydrolase n=1 Tax=Pseudomonas viridiflava TaxID=33069 RepID=UPI002A6A34EE|nr:alpha/beta hydrolase [Pseudomonas viridiflava]MDY0936616.1 alpha/beta hydrolase [Pseudomonas viridiflava]MDY1012082.1 alpha/beta hydrolase [Pseudomonas viridiflava]